MRRLKKLITVAVLAAFAATSAIADAPFKDQRFVYRADGKKLTEVLQDFAAAQSVPLVLDASVEGTVNAEFNAKPTEFLSALSKTYNLIWYFDGTTLFVYPSRAMVSRVFRMRGYDRDQVKQMLSSLGLGDPRFPLRFNDAEQTLLAYGPPRHIELVQTVIDTLDNGARDQVSKTIRVFPLHNAVAADRVSGQTRVPGLAATLNNIFSGGQKGAGGASEAVTQLTGGSGVGTAEKRRSAELNFGLKSDSKKDAEREDNGQLKNGETDNIKETRDRPFFQADEASNSIIVRGVPESMKQYESLIQQLDMPQDLVEIEATIIDVSSDEFESLGLDWAGSNITTLVGDSGRALLNHVRALEGSGKGRIVARPKVLGAANRPATMTDKRVASVRVAGNLDSNLFTVEAGTTLEVTPQVIPSAVGGEVRLTLYIQDGSFEGNTVDSVPIVKRTEIRTDATIREGESLLVGGISLQSQSTSKTGVPGLSHIPGLGALFRQDVVSDSRSERMFLITPKVIHVAGSAPLAPPPIPDREPVVVGHTDRTLAATVPPAAYAVPAVPAVAPAQAATPVDCPALALGLPANACSRPGH
jgi:type III secretion protein C